MKIQISRSETIFEEANVNFPIYSKVEESNKTYYTKITKTEFFHIVFGVTGIECITRFKTNNKIISELWIKNKSDWREFQNAKRAVKKYLYGF